MSMKKYLWPLLDAIEAERMLATVEISFDSDAAEADWASLDGFLRSSAADFVGHYLY